MHFHCFPPGQLYDKDYFFLARVVELDSVVEELVVITEDDLVAFGINVCEHPVFALQLWQRFQNIFFD